ncbi:hypothetical protein B4125_3916 [Bacillus paralicheniformis]|nr:hypothetical protein B4125_3916 [Bacillus paralicheniformis]
MKRHECHTIPDSCQSNRFMTFYCLTSLGHIKMSGSLLVDLIMYTWSGA